MTVDEVYSINYIDGLSDEDIENIYDGFDLKK